MTVPATRRAPGKVRHAKKDLGPRTAPRRGSLWARIKATTRLAVRQVHRTPGSSALVIALIALPITGFSSALVFFDSHQPTAAQQVSSQFGTFDARIEGSQYPNSNMHQALASINTWQGTGAQPETPEPAPTTIPALVPSGADVVTLDLSRWAEIKMSDRISGAMVIAGPVWDKRFAGMFTLESGRIPANKTEALVSPGFLDRIGAKIGDSITATDEAGTKVTITGTMSSQAMHEAPQIYVPRESTLGDNSDVNDVWFVSGWTPTIDDLRTLNTQGYGILGKDLILNPPASYTEGPGGGTSGSTVGVLTIVIGAAIFAAVVVALIAGAAMSVSARRQQRSLAMAAGVGASRGDLFAIVIGQGMVLGLIAGVIGIGLGIGAVGIPYKLGLGEGMFGRWWGLHLPWAFLAAVCAFSILIAFLASLKPARLASSGDTLAALRGARHPVILQRAMPRWGVGVLLFGLAASVVGMVFITVTDTTSPVWQGVVAAVLSLAGPLIALVGIGLSGHWLVTAFARTTAKADVATRLAARDSAANPSRTVPAFLAIASAALMSTAALSLTGMGFEKSSRVYAWSAPLHHVSASVWAAEPSGVIAQPEVVLAEARKVLQTAGATNIIGVNTADSAAFDEKGEIATPKTPVVHAGSYEGATCKNPSCFQGFTFATWAGAVVIPAADLPQTVGVTLTAAQREAYNRGAALVSDELTYVHDNKAVVFETTAGQAEKASNSLYGDTSSTRSAQDFGTPHLLDVIPSDPKTLSAPIVIAPETAKKLGISYSVTELVGTTSQPLSTDQEDKLRFAADNASSSAGNISARVERGPQAADGWLAFIAAVTMLVVMGTALVTLGLARYERRPDDATLTAVGGPSGVRRRVNMMQALLIVGIGAVLGAGLGLLPAYAYSLSTGGEMRVVDIPFPWIIGLAIGLPLVMAAMAWLVPPRKPDLARRTVIT